MDARPSNRGLHDEQSDEDDWFEWDDVYGPLNVLVQATSWREVAKLCPSGGRCTLAIPHGTIEIDDRAFRYCEQIRSILIPNTVTTIGTQAFEFCDQLVSVSIPDSVTGIRVGAFRGCHRLTTLTLPPRLERLWPYAFRGCHSLTSVTIPPSCGKIGHHAFADCRRLVVATVGRPDREFHRTIDGCNIFEWCDRLRCVVAPSIESSLPSNWGAPADVIFDDTPASRRMALRLQYWSLGTHSLCSVSARRWVREVLLVAARLAGRGPRLPDEMWVAIFGWVRRDLLGSALQLP